MNRVVAVLLIAIYVAACVQRSEPSDLKPGDAKPEAGLVERHPTVQIARFVQPQVDWWHVVSDTGDNRFLLVVFNTDSSSAHPLSVTADGVAMQLLATQGAPSYGALSAWGQTDPVTGGTHIEASIDADPIWGFGYSASFQGVEPLTPITNVAGFTHGGGGPFTQNITTAVGDLALIVVSWGNSQSTDWQGDAYEIWDTLNPGAGSSLGGAAAVIEGTGTDVTFIWDDNPGDTSGASLGFSIRAAR